MLSNGKYFYSPFDCSSFGLLSLHTYRSQVPFSLFSLKNNKE